MRNRKALTILLVVVVSFFVWAGCSMVGMDGTGVTPSLEPTGRPVTKPVATAAPAQGDESAANLPETEPASGEPTGASESTSTEEVAEPPITVQICPGVSRPAILVLVGQEYALTNPLTQERCAIQFDSQPFGLIQNGGESLFFHAMDPERGTSVGRMGPHGEMVNLDFTATPNSSFFAYVASSDGSLLAWSAADYEAQRSDLWLAPTGETSDEEIRVMLDDFVDPAAGGFPRFVEPLRFSPDKSELYFALQPTGLGGLWNSFSGRYDSLYAISASGGEPRLLFDCRAIDGFLCIGDFTSNADRIAYVDEGAGVIRIIQRDGNEMAVVPADADYLAYPTFGANDTLAYYSATLPASESGFPLPQPGTLHTLNPPYDGTPTVIHSEAGLLPPQQWLDPTHIVSGFTDNDAQWGAAVIGLDGTRTLIEPWPDAQVAGVWSQ